MLDEAIPLLEQEKQTHELLFAYVVRAVAQTCLGQLRRRALWLKPDPRTRPLEP